MKCILPASAFFFALATAASASAGLGCSAADKNVAALAFEGLTPRDATHFVNFDATLEVVVGEKIEFSREHVKTFNWGKNIAVHFARQTSRGLADIRIYAKPVGDEDIDFEGSYVVRLGKLTKRGKIKCSGG